MHLCFHKSTTTPTSMSSFHSLLRASVLLLHQHFHLQNFLGLSFIRTYSFSLSLSLKPSFHALLPHSCILTQIYFFHPSPSTFILRFTISITLTFLKQIRFTNSNSPNLLHMCLHLDHRLDLHHISIKHALPTSDTIFSSNTTLNIHFTIALASLSSKVLHHVSPLISSFLIFPTSQSHLPIPFCLTSKSSHSCWYMLVFHIHTLACLPPYSSILLCQLHIYFQTLLLHI